MHASSPARSLRAASVAAALALGLVAVGCSSSASDSSPTPTTAATAGKATTTTTPAPKAFTGKDFYAVPSHLPTGPHGTLIRYQAMADYDMAKSTAYRIMYLSESVAGDPIAVTGIGIVPDQAAPAGGRRMITLSHGTTGIADECAPSKDPRITETTLISKSLSPTFLIAATDDEGLGTPGRHPYLVGESEGRSAIDALLAARQLPDAHPGKDFAIAGYSQGGHGALWTAQVSKAWAPDLHLVGTFSGAPASEIGVIVSAASKVKGFGMMVIAGIDAAYPEAHANLDEILTPKGIQVMDAVDHGCAPATFAAVGKYDGSELFVPDGGQSKPWKQLGAAQDAGTEKTNDAPTLIIHSTGDQTVPTFFIDQVEHRMCANGQVVERRDIDGGGHAAAAIPAYEQAIPWLQARFDAGSTGVDDTCPS